MDYNMEIMDYNIYKMSMNYVFYQIAISFFGACAGPLMGFFLISGTSCLKWVRSRVCMRFCYEHRSL